MLAAALVWRWRAAVAVGLVVAVAVSAGFSAPQVRDRVSGSSFDRLTSGRGKLLTNGVEIALDNPVLGVGVGSFKRAYADRVGLRGREPRRGASHTTPVTVAAETGFLGLALFLWLLATAFFVTLRPMQPSTATRTLFITGIALAAITVHSLFYNAFFEDPMTWGLLGLAALTARARRSAEAVA